METDASHSLTSSNKRKLDDDDDYEDETVTGHHPQGTQAPPPREPTRKCRVEEGFSWWTCAMYGMPYEKSRPQARPTDGNQG